MSLSAYGKLPSGERLKRIRLSQNYRNGAFQNISKTNVMAEDASFTKTFRDFLHKPKNVQPSAAIHSIKSDLKNLPGNKTALIWFGHSSYLLKTGGQNVLVDPVFSGHAAPVRFMVKAFKGADIYAVEDLPAIDVLLLTHDHYDHLDYKTILKLKGKFKKVVCSLGIGSHLENWGVDPALIAELDWWESFTNGSITFTCTPARHFSGRGIKRGQTLWGSFVVASGSEKYFLGGDSGYDKHFKEIGDKFGPFDMAILECGQYNRSWPNIHMMPEEVAQAAMDLRSKLVLPVHWGKFTLAMHGWTEPVTRLLAESIKKGVKVALPMIGETMLPLEKVPDKKWWL